jgi:hypothetical protein
MQGQFVVQEPMAFKENPHAPVFRYFALLEVQLFRSNVWVPE